MKHFSYLGFVGALLLPVSAFALTTPNVFQTGATLSASALNQNFSSVEQEVNELRSDLDALAAQQGGSAPRINECQWIYQTCENGGTTTDQCLATCPDGTGAISGGCDSTAGNLMDSFPGLGLGDPFPEVPAPAAVFPRWSCRTDVSTKLIAYALCCPAE